MTAPNEITLIFIEGSRKGERITLNKETVSMGRSDDCDIVFNNPNVSRLHSTLRKTPFGWELTDQSTNGTYLSNGEFLHNASKNINNNETIQLSKSGEKVCVVFPSDGMVRREPGNDERQSNSVFTKVLPVIRPDFVKGLRSQPFFYVGLITAIAGILLFAFLQAALTDTGKSVETYVYLYEGTLGAYLGSMIILSVSRLCKTRVPVWFLFAPAIFTMIFTFLGKPLFGLTSELSVIRDWLHPYNKSFITALIGHFFGVGLVEELFKSIPVWLAILFSARLSKARWADLSHGRLSANLAVIIGTSSAVGFIITETLTSYVPLAQQHGNIAVGMMLLIPRFITGISGHVAWSGLFAYFIGLSQSYPQNRASLILGGWVIAALLHGLWNACGVTDMQVFGGIVAIASFIVFSAYFYKSRG